MREFEAKHPYGPSENESCDRRAVYGPVPFGGTGGGPPPEQGGKRPAPDGAGGLSPGEPKTGGADGGRIGTSAIRIQNAIESLEDCDHILIYADLGSSVLSAETAIDIVDEDLAEKVQIVDAPIVEGALAGVVQATISDDVNEVIRVSEEARNAHKV